MQEENDWRLRGQETYLKNITLWRKKYTRRRANWEHDHCEFCWAKFMPEDYPDALHDGYVTEDNYHWICESCFEDFKDLFDWRVIAENREL